MHSRLLKTLGLTLTLSLGTNSAIAENAANNLRAFFESREIPITIDNFVRAATEIEFAKYLSLSGGVNKLFHVHEPTAIDQQPTIRMNRDTLYSMAVIDVSQGAELTLPETGDRYISAHIINQDHYTNAVFLGGGTYTMDFDTFDTPYVVAIIRILVDASDPKDIAAVKEVQNQIALSATSETPFVLPHYDQDSFEGALQAALALGRFASDSNRTFGARSDVDPIRHFLGTAFGWGGLPEEEAFYLTVDPNLPIGEYKIEVPADVPVDAFWSVSVYNEAGFFEKNALGVYNINSVSGGRNSDGSMTVHLGGCEDGRANCVPLTQGWNYAVRLYRPSAEIIDGSWTFPSARPVE